MNINNATSRVFSMNTIWTQDYQNKKTAAILQEYSAKKYGRKREYVEAETKARLGIFDEEETPIDTVLENPNSADVANTTTEVSEKTTQTDILPSAGSTENSTLTDKILTLEESTVSPIIEENQEKPLNNTTASLSPDSSSADPLSTASENTNEI